jgi:hypothetical protein
MPFSYDFFSLFTICRVRVPYPFQWGRPDFNAGDTFAIMASAFVAIIEVKFRDLILI